MKKIRINNRNIVIILVVIIITTLCLIMYIDNSIKNKPKSNITQEKPEKKDQEKKEKEKIIKKIVKDNICCLEEIKDFFKIEESNDPYILNNNKEIYFSDKHDILQYIKNGILNIYYNIKTSLFPIRMIRMETLMLIDK